MPRRLVPRSPEGEGGCGTPLVWDGHIIRTHDFLSSVKLNLYSANLSICTTSTAPQGELKRPETLGTLSFLGFTSSAPSGSDRPRKFFRPRLKKRVAYPTSAQLGGSLNESRRREARGRSTGNPTLLTGDATFLLGHRSPDLRLSKRGFGPRIGIGEGGSRKANGGPTRLR